MAKNTPALRRGWWAWPARRVGMGRTGRSRDGSEFVADADADHPGVEIGIGADYRAVAGGDGGVGIQQYLLHVGVEVPAVGQPVIEASLEGDAPGIVVIDLAQACGAVLVKIGR